MKNKSVKQFIEEQKMERIKTQHECLAKTIKDIATKIYGLNKQKFK